MKITPTELLKNFALHCSEVSQDSDVIPCADKRAALARMKSFSMINTDDAVVGCHNADGVLISYRRVPKGVCERLKQAAINDDQSTINKTLRALAINMTKAPEHTVSTFRLHIWQGRVIKSIVNQIGSSTLSKIVEFRKSYGIFDMYLISKKQSLKTKIIVLSTEKLSTLSKSNIDKMLSELKRLINNWLNEQMKNVTHKL